LQLVLSHLRRVPVGHLPDHPPGQAGPDRRFRTAAPLAVREGHRGPTLQMLSASAQPGTTSEHRRQAARAPRLPLMAMPSTPPRQTQPRRASAIRMPASSRSRSRAAKLDVLVRATEPTNRFLRPSRQHRPMGNDDHSSMSAILTGIRRAFSPVPSRVPMLSRAPEPSRATEAARIVEPARPLEPTRHVDYRWEATRSLF
jgi:hypothetical protein